MYLFLLCCNHTCYNICFHSSFCALARRKMISSYFAPHSSVWNEKYAKYISAASPLEIMELQRFEYYSLCVTCNLIFSRIGVEVLWAFI